MGEAPVEVPWVIGQCKPGCSDHYRRLVSHRGWYVDDKTCREKEAQLVFWTEWEACTTAVNLWPTNKVPDYAHSVHTVKTPLKGYRPGGINTDPCVFGTSFKYCCCQQTENGTMRSLAPGSLILFGSHLSDRFFLDTVFVVDGEGIPYEGGTNGLTVSREYRELALKRLDSGKNTLYCGKAFRSADKGHPYSFTPVRLFDAKDACCGERFSLDLAKLNQCLPRDARQFAPGLNQKFKAIESSPEVILAVWNEIVRQVLDAKFFLGVHFDWPIQ